MDSSIEEQELYYERYINEGSRSFNPYIGLDEKYHHNSENKSFMVPCYKIPINELQVVSDNPSDDIKKDFIFEDGYRFCIHPQFINDENIIERFKEFERIDDLEVSPTSSMRTLKVRGKNYYIKLHCPAKISNYERKIGAMTAKHAAIISKQLRDVEIEGFRYLPESLSLAVIKTNDIRSFGCIVREYIPHPNFIREIKTKKMPYFCLYSKDKYNPENPALITKFIDNSGMTPFNFVTKKLLIPVLKHWIYVFRNYGIVLESHGQNLLMEIDDNFNIYSWIIRDMDLRISSTIRKEKGLSLEGLDPYWFIEKEEKFASSLSIIFDRSIGGLLFDYIAECVNKMYGIEKKDLQNVCKEYILTEFPDYYKYFPDQEYTIDFKNTADIYNIEMIVQSEIPSWRPSNFINKGLKE